MMGIAIPQSWTDWLAIVIAVTVATAANTIALKWASYPEWVNPYTGWLVFISPVVFITFGRVASSIGLASGSVIIDSLLVVATVAIGLVFFNEWSKLSWINYLGILVIFVGVYMVRMSKPFPEF